MHSGACLPDVTTRHSQVTILRDRVSSLRPRAPAAFDWIATTVSSCGTRESYLDVFHDLIEDITDSDVRLRTSKETVGLKGVEGASHTDIADRALPVHGRTEGDGSACS